jgi:hypothetical protein
MFRAEELAIFRAGVPPHIGQLDSVLPCAQPIATTNVPKARLKKGPRLRESARHFWRINLQLLAITSHIEEILDCTLGRIAINPQGRRSGGVSLSQHSDDRRFREE